MKKILIALAVVFALFAGGFYAFTKTNTDQVVRRQLRAMLQEATQTDSWVQRAMIAPDQGQGQIQNIRIKNPEGFSNQEALSISSVMARFTPSATAQERQITVQELVIDKPQILYETNAAGKSNLKAISRTLQNYANEKIAEKVQKLKNQDPSFVQDWRFIVKEVKVTGGEIIIVHQSLANGPVKMPMEDFTLHNLGVNRKGLFSDELTVSLLGALCQHATMQGAMGLVREIAKNSPLLKRPPAEPMPQP